MVIAKEGVMSSATMSSVEERLQRLEDREAIRELKIAYAKACDGYDIDQVVSLMTDDVVWDGGERFGRHEGKAAVRAFLSETWKQLTWALHYMTGESITIAPSGTEATGSWYLWEPCTMSDRAIWLAGRYDDEYRKVDGRWYFSRVTLRVDMSTPFEAGWVKQRYA
jgi:ketosteroid isomerase-like protein